MTAKELITILQKVPEDTTVVIVYDEYSERFKKTLKEENMCWYVHENELVIDTPEAK